MPFEQRAPSAPPVRRVVVAVNPTAGGGRAIAAHRTAMAVLAGPTTAGVAPPWPVQDLQAASAESLAALVRPMLAEPGTALVVVGGDGMVNLGVNQVAGTGVPLGIVAAGTGNDNARELGLPVGDVTAAAHAVRQALLSGHTHPTDAARWSSADGAAGWFVGVLGAGFDAIVNERANAWRKVRGRIRYDLAIARELPVFRPRPYTIDLDGVRRTERAVLVAVGNGPAYGGGLRMCHGALMDDGLLDVVVAGDVGRLGLLRLYPRVWTGDHLRHRRVTRHPARSVRLDAPGIVAYADGERLGPLPLQVEVAPGALRMLGRAAGSQ